MIIDVHSHVWEYPRHFSDDFIRQARRGYVQEAVEVDAQRLVVQTAREHSNAIRN